MYPILDAEMVLREAGTDHGKRADRLRRIVAELAEAGVEILQYRNKRDADAVVAADAEVIREAVEGSGARMRLILNDRAGLVAALGWDGVHVGQEDLPVREARRLVGEGVWVGLSTHNESQMRAAEAEPVEYIAVGPVFATSSKANPDPAIGPEGVRRARAMTAKPLVAIGGITAETAQTVVEAGADSVAVIAAIFGTGRAVGDSARDFLAKFK
ncbi:MAG: thiamine phosphate synthase [Acidobacteriota bacterium]